MPPPSYQKPRSCINPQCHDTLEHASYVLCPSCAFVGKVCFAIGVIIAGILLRIFAK